MPKPLIKARVATASSIEYEVIGYVDELSKKNDARNALFDLAQRHLAASGIFLRCLTVDAVRVEPVGLAGWLLRRVEMFDSIFGIHPQPALMGTDWSANTSESNHAALRLGAFQVGAGGRRCAFFSATR